MKLTELEKQKTKGLNIFIVVIISSIIYLLINIFFYTVKENIVYFELLANTILLFTTFYLIYVTQRNSTNKSGFYYYTSIGFSFLFFGLFILTLDNVYSYSEDVVKVSIKLLFVFGYSLLAIGVTKWIKYNETRQDELVIQANTDELTGLLNRRSFTKYMEFEYSKAKAQSEPFSLIILDIDFFKTVNDSHGHLVGDKVLINLANVMKSSFRNADRVSRWGGEEFAILLPKTSLKNAEVVAEKIRCKIEGSPYSHVSLSIKYTISLGVTEWLVSDVNIDDVINRADDALYQAKEDGRNCVSSIRA